MGKMKFYIKPDYSGQISKARNYSTLEKVLVATSGDIMASAQTGLLPVNAEMESDYYDSLSAEIRRVHPKFKSDGLAIFNDVECKKPVLILKRKQEKSSESDE